MIQTAAAAKEHLTPLILEFSQVSGADVPRVGGKGANLGELTRAGLDVPPGFCVTTTAFRQFMGSYEGANDLYMQLESLQAEDVEGARLLGQNVRSQLRRVAVPAEVAQALRAAWHALGEEYAYAVRSSATAEDLPDASFAGQQDTYLNVRGEGALLESVHNCWISLFTDRAILYRLQNGFGHREVALSVVVQQLVEPEVSGIMFTADPVTGKRSTLSIDASFGLGEALVAGLVSADLYQVDKPHHTVVKRQIADKKLMIRTLAGGGVERVTLEDSVRHQPSLTDAQALELAALGARIETHYGQPQDIEWALAAGRFYLLQSRPITSLFPLPEPAPRDDALHVYISFSHAQVMTDPISVMGRSVWRILAPFGRPAGHLENPYLCSAAGRLYFDVSPMMRHPLTKRLLPGILTVADPLIAAAVKTVGHQGAFQARGGRIRPHDLRRWFAPIFLKVIAKLWWEKPEGVPARLLAQFARYIAQVKAQLAAVPAGATRLELAQQLLQNVFVTQALPLPPYIGAGILSQVLLRRLLPDPAHADDLAAITRGLVGNVTTEMDLAVGDLADAARGSPELVEHLSQAGIAAASLLASAAEVPGGPVFLGAWEGFLGRYGMRGPSEIDIARPRWHEDPRSLLQMVVGNLQGDMGAHRLYHAQLVEAGEAAAARLRVAAGQGSWAWLKAPVVKRLTRVARYLPAVREHPKFLLIQVMDLIKGVIVEAAEQLASQGRLEQEDEVWFLSLPELIETLENRDLSVRQRIEVRRKEMTRFYTLTPPRVMTSDGEIPVVEHAVTDAPAGALIGNPVSAGVAEGVARVVRDPQSETLRPGEILVAPFTDPGWTPLFIQAAGLVMEVGGLMTHGSVVAREYGIPAVVGVLGATQRIRSGQRIRVHGSAGYVELLGDEERLTQKDTGAAQNGAFLS